MPEGWLELVSRELGIDVEIELGALLDTARDVAHNVERKATPLTTFLLGVAVGRSRGESDLPRLCERVSALALRWGQDADGRPS